jgi:hypothetical protein
VEQSSPQRLSPLPLDRYPLLRLLLPSSPPSSDSDPDKPYTYTYSATDRPPNTADTLPDWIPPSTPPPDDPDPFLSALSRPPPITNYDSSRQKTLTVRWSTGKDLW